MMKMFTKCVSKIKLPLKWEIFQIKGLKNCVKNNRNILQKKIK